MLEDLSTKDVFMFRSYCAACGKAYANQPTHFSKAGTVPGTREKQILYKAIYEQELRLGRHSTIEKAMENINYCPTCKQLACNWCFLICDDLDICVGCAAQLKESGTPALSNILEAAM